MIDIRLQLAAEEFIGCVKSSEAVKEFQNAERAFRSDPEITRIRTDYVSLAQEYQKKQSSGGLTQEEINRIRMLQAMLNKHPITVRYAQSRQTMIMMLRDCNAAISEVLGFDFAATAAPASRC